jgi:CheY-like chemotaxis protein
MPRILIVEDDPVASLIYSHHLEHVGYSIAVASSGLAAIEMLEEVETHAVVTDLLMPMMDGHELCERIRADERWKDLPIFLVTGVAVPDELAWIDDFPNIQLLEKPIKITNLIEALDAKLSVEPSA